MKTLFKHFVEFGKNSGKVFIMAFKTLLILMDHWSTWTDREWKRYHIKMKRKK